MSTTIAALRPAHSILRANDLAEAVAHGFAIGPVERCRLYRSFINDVYRVEAGGRLWFLRIAPSSWRTVAEVEAEIAFMRALGAAGAPVAEPVPLASGSGHVLKLTAPEGPRAAVLFVGVTGEAEPVFANTPDALGIARRYGQVSARLHAVADGLPPILDRPAMDLEAMLWRPLALIAAQLDGPEDRDDLARIGERLTAALAGAPLKRGFAHGDLNSSNILFGDTRETVIDFDCCGWGYRANDIAAFARGITLSRLPGAEASALIAAQLAGYAVVSPIDEGDIAALPAFLLVQRLWMASLHYERQDRFGLVSFGPAYTARLMNWLRSWETILDTPPDWLAAAAGKPTS